MVRNEPSPDSLGMTLAGLAAVTNDRADDSALLTI